LNPGFTVQSCAIILASSNVSPKAGVPEVDKKTDWAVPTTSGVRLAKPWKVPFVSRAATRSRASVGGPCFALAMQ
jgi:hypothetical protein